MSVIICLHPKYRNVVEELAMSNAGMAVFLSVIVLSGSRLAIEKKEKELVQWFSERDDTVRGRGCNGFDMSEIPWEKDTFEKEREFLLRVANGAKVRLGWEVLNYQPKEEFVFGYLEKFTTLLHTFKKEYIDENVYQMWLEEEHKVLQFYIPKDYPDCDEESKNFLFKTMETFEEQVWKINKYLDINLYSEWAEKQEFPNLVLPDGFHVCKEHGAIISWNGCIVCNDM